MQRFVPFSKIDDEKRTVYGLASDETLDADDEIIDYEATKKAVQEWAEWRNIREMHGNSAVGVADEIYLDDEQRALHIAARVVDDAAWEKCKEGVYKGFSIGGKVLKKVLDIVGARSIRRVVDYVLLEISLVDRPANPSARFNLIKRGGASMEDDINIDDEEEIPSENSGEGEETSPAEDEEMMTPETVKAIVLEMLKELGIVREEFAQAAHVDDLRKSVQNLAPIGDVAAVASDLKKAVGDIAATVAAVEQLGERLVSVEKQAAGQGPVLREIGQFITQPGGQEMVLKSLFEETNDPNLRQMIGQKLAELQIRAARGNHIGL
jgi:phage head maturation protease